MRLINSDDVKTALSEMVNGTNGQMPYDFDRATYEIENDLDTVIDSVPTVEAEPIIRCKDCKYGEPYHHIDALLACNKRAIPITKSVNGFCDEAEPKMDGKENG